MSACYYICRFLLAVDTSEFLVDRNTYTPWLLQGILLSSKLSAIRTGVTS